MSAGAYRTREIKWGGDVDTYRHIYFCMYVRNYTQTSVDNQMCTHACKHAREGHAREGHQVLIIDPRAALGQSV